MRMRAAIAFVLSVSAVSAAGACGGSKAAAPDAGGPPALGTPAQTWTYVPVPGNICMDSSATGIGVNLGTTGDLVLYMEGGGACFNDATCGSVAHPDGWGPADFAANITPYNIGIFDRIDPKNPLKDATYVFVPYCTGDVHAGSNPTGMGNRVMVGYENVGRIVDFLKPQLGAVTRVVVTGSSAGGFGSLINFDRVADGFAPLPSVLIDDSGPPLGDTYLTPCLQQQFRDAWNLAAAIPTGCTACTESNGGGLTNATTWLADNHPNSRLALISSIHDGTIRSFFGYGYPTCGDNGPMPEDAFAAGIAELRDTTLAAHTNFRVYSVDSDLHVWLLRDPLDGVSPNADGSGEHLAQWLTDMLDDTTPWDSVTPTNVMD